MLCELEVNGFILCIIYDSVLLYVEYCFSLFGELFNWMFVGLDDWVCVYWFEMEWIWKMQVDFD